MAKRDKMVTKSGTEIDCNIVGFMDGLNGGKIIIYTTFDNEKELLASYYALKGNKIILSEIKNDDEWDNIENALQNDKLWYFLSKQKKEDNMKLKTAILQKRSLDRQYEKSTGIILEKMAETAENNADILLRWETPSEK